MNVKLIAAAVALSVGASAAQAAELFNNGPVVNSDGLAIKPPQALILGFGAKNLADNFSVAASGWNVSSLDFYGYEIAAGGFTFTTATWRIISGADINAGVVVASGATAVTNAGLQGYGVTSATLTSQDRAIYRINADVADFHLGAGSYFLAWSLTGSGSVLDGPYVTAVDGSLGAGNALDANGDGAFETIVEQGSGLSVELPFTINGTLGMPVPEPATWAMMIGGFGTIGGALRNRRRQAVTRFA